MRLVTAQTRLTFRVFGSLEVFDREQPVWLSRRKHRVLLAILLLRAGDLMSTDALIEHVWGEWPPRTARDALQNYVSLLRKKLGSEVLLTRSAGYVLDVDPEQIDLGRFERLAAEARATEAAGERIEKLRQALSLWRGPPLADLAFEPFAQLEIARLEAQRLAAEQDLIDAELATRLHTAVVPRLEALVQQHPFDERLRGQLMLALYRSGRQAEALFTYQATRALLVEELGLEPGPRLKELEAAILRQDVALTAPAVRAPLPTAMGDGCLLRMVRRHEEPVGRYHDAENGPQRREVSVPRKIDALVHSGAWTVEDAEERICLL